MFILSLSVWLSGLMAGMYFALSADKTIACDVDEYIQSIAGTNSGYFEVLKNGILTNLRYTAFLCLSSSFMVFMPLTAFLIGFKGFSAGYTASFIVRLYAVKGVAATVTGIILPLCLSLPVLFVMYVSCLEFPVKTFKLRSSISSLERWRMYLSYVAKMFVLFFVLSIITAAEAFLTPHFFSVLLK